jgi:S1-C subfamily serine protease
MNRRALLPLVAAVPIAAFAAGCGSSSSPSAAPASTEAPAIPLAYANGDLDLIPNLVEELQPSIVSVLVQTGSGGGQGSGVVWDGSQGLIVTNNHVVEGATAVEVELASGERLPATVRATDAATDLAVIEVDRTDLPSADFAPELPRVGELAIAIGNPLGFENTVTAGIVSALHRNLDQSTYIDLIQTDAPISPGNSGGALVNGQGQVIGINSAGIAPEDQANSLGFAIPSPTVISIVQQLVDGGHAGLAFLGVASEPTAGGVRVTEVTSGSAAEAAGVAAGDVITAVGDAPIGSTEELVSALRAHAPGDQVTVTVERGAETIELTVTLGDRSQQA